MSTKTTIVLVACLLGISVVVLRSITPVHRGMRPSCVNNLRQLEGAKEQWVLEFHKNTTDLVTAADLRPYLRTMLLCPQGGVYTLGRVGELPSCSIPEHTAQYREHP